jgi:ribosomal protein S27AE
MQVRTVDRPPVGPSSRAGPVRRIFESIADFLSPRIECGECGGITVQRRCETTGVVRPVPSDAQWSRWTASETEYLCPRCGASIWVLDVPIVYPIG